MQRGPAASSDPSRGEPGWVKIQSLQRSDGALEHETGSALNTTETDGGLFRQCARGLANQLGVLARGRTYGGRTPDTSISMDGEMSRAKPICWKVALTVLSFKTVHHPCGVLVCIPTN